MSFRERLRGGVCRPSLLAAMPPADDPLYVTFVPIELVAHLKLPAEPNGLVRFGDGRPAGRYLALFNYGAFMLSSLSQMQPPAATNEA